MRCISAAAAATVSRPRPAAAVAAPCGPQPVAASGSAIGSSCSSARFVRWRRHCCPWQPARPQPQPQLRRRQWGKVAASAASGGSASAAGGQQDETLADVMANIFQQLAAMQQPQQQGAVTCAHLHVAGLCYQPAGRQEAVAAVPVLAGW